MTAAVGVHLIDGVERNRKAPTTFEIPHPSEIEALQPHDLIKIGVEVPPGERFWCRIKRRIGDRFEAIIWDRPFLSHFHGLRSGQTITVERRHILATMTNAQFWWLDSPRESL